MHQNTKKFLIGSITKNIHRIKNDGKSSDTQQPSLTYIGGWMRIIYVGGSFDMRVLMVVLYGLPIKKFQYNTTAPRNY
jgi:hypothetical protein